MNNLNMNSGIDIVLTASGIIVNFPNFDKCAVVK